MPKKLPSIDTMTDTNIPNAAKVKLPEFLSSDPVVWMTICEAIFESHGIVDTDHRFNVVLAALPVQVVSKIKGILVSPMDGQKYDVLKSRLKQLYGRTMYEQYQALLMVPSLQSNQRPSDLLGSMIAAIQDQQTDNNWLFLCMFLSRLPASVRAHCAAMDFKGSMQALAAEADRRIQDTTALSTGSVHPDGMSLAANSCEEFAAAFPAQTVGNTLCYIHYKYGAQAKNCRPPCSWQSSTTSSRRSNKHSGNEQQAVRT